ncbi:sensor histidine kinase [Nocardiopsis oceani]
MAAHLSDRKRSRLRPGQQALVALLVASALTAPAWSWTVIESPDASRPAIAVIGGVSGILLCAALALAAYHAAAARNARDHGTRVSGGARTLEAEAGWVVDVLLPAVAHATREGRSVQEVLDEHLRPTHPTVDRLARAVTTQVASAERRAAEDRATRVEIEEEVTDLADAGLPRIIHRIHEDRPTAAESLNREFHDIHEPVAHLRGRILDEILAAERRTATALVSAASSGARIQAHLTTLLAQLRELQDRYGDRSDIFSDLLLVDHNVSRTGRLADAFVVLAHGRSGRRWTRPIIMESILRGAMGRITAYRRVRLHFTSRVAVVGYAAEGVMQALAELMDNAANFSAHGTDVHVYVEEEDTGVAITVEDSGLGMRHRERRVAESVITEPRDLSTLPGSKTGLAVVGCLADKYGLTVSFRPSARGGIGVVVLIPPNLLTEPRMPKRRPRAASDSSAVGVFSGAVAGVPASSGEALAVTGETAPPAVTGESGVPAAADASAAVAPTDDHRPPLPRRDGTRTATGPHQNPGLPADAGVQVTSGGGTHGNDGGDETATGEGSSSGTVKKPVNLPRRRRGHTLAEAVRENPEQLFPTKRTPLASRAREQAPTRFAAFRDPRGEPEESSGESD